jgi:DNA sulfur modification protein DndD
LKKLNDEIVANQESKKNALLLDRISADDFTKSVSSFLIEKQVSNISSLDIIELFRGLIADTTDCIDFDFSTSQITRILSQIYEKCSFEKKEIIKTISKINASINKSKKLRDRLMSTSVDGYESFVTDKEAIEKSITNLLVEIEKNKQLVEAQKLVCEISQREFIKAKDDYSLILKNKSIMDMSERAVATYTLLEEKLVRRQAALLQKEFIKCFNSIINKDSFIDGIVIDKTISIIPYKFINVRKQQLKNYLMANKDFISLFDTSEFTFAINDMELGKVDEITLPAPIKAPFSQGERQVYIMSIYLALLKTSHKDIPFFIDTPFARIDSNHRTNIVTEFFNKIKNQLFILSTDEEIVGEYKAMMEDKISDKYTLSISEYGSTAIIPDVYFGGQ